MDSDYCGSPSNHVVLFPYMSKGHMIPMLHLARLLLRRKGMSVTVFTTPANRLFVVEYLADTRASVTDLPFPQMIPEIPSGVESTDKLPSMSLFVPFTRATKQMQPDFERALQTLPPVSLMVSDGFLWWTLESATKFGFPRLVFYGMSTYASCVAKNVSENRLLVGVKSDHELIAVPAFPWIKVTRGDFNHVFQDPDPKACEVQLFMDQMRATYQSHGLIVNSFYDLESVFADYYNRHGGLKAWYVGPLCLADPHKAVAAEKPTWIQWLDRKLEDGCSVLYVAFGSQSEISPEQLEEIANGLEESKVNFLWVIREKESELGEGFEERVKGRGIVVRDWVDQREILMHQSVQGFLSHCGWNSVMESICAGVPILAWPMLAEQPLNARMVEDEIKVGLRVETSDGTVRGFVKPEALAKMVKELMEGEMGKEVRKKVKKLSTIAKMAMEEGTGSSWLNLDMLISEICKPNKIA